MVWFRIFVFLIFLSIFPVVYNSTWLIGDDWIKEINLTSIQWKFSMVCRIYWCQLSINSWTPSLLTWRKKIKQIIGIFRFMNRSTYTYRFCSAPWDEFIDLYVLYCEKRFWNLLTSFLSPQTHNEVLMWDKERKGG